MLANLRAGYTRRGDKRLLAEVLRMRALLPERPPAEDGELAGRAPGGRLVRRGRRPRANGPPPTPEGADRSRLEARAQRLRAKLELTTAVDDLTYAA